MLALVIGLGPGLSTAIVERFAAEGFAVAGIARNVARSSALAERLRAGGARVLFESADAGDAVALGAAIAKIERELGPVDVLVYNAYRSTFAPPSQVGILDFVEDFRVNVAGALAAVQAVLPGMRARRRGTVLLTGGGLALDPTGWLDAASLAVGKAGLRSLARSLHAELASEGIRVTTITIAGAIAAGTPMAPERLAEAFWRAHASAERAAEAEIVIRG